MLPPRRAERWGASRQQTGPTIMNHVRGREQLATRDDYLDGFLRH